MFDVHNFGLIALRDLIRMRTGRRVLTLAEILGQIPRRPPIALTLAYAPARWLCDEYEAVTPELLDQAMNEIAWYAGMDVPPMAPGMFLEDPHPSGLDPCLAQRPHEAVPVCDDY